MSLRDIRNEVCTGILSNTSGYVCGVFFYVASFIRVIVSVQCPDLMHCTNELSVSIPHLADTLIERTSSQSWVVVFKTLITTHHLMMYGNEVRSAALFSL